MRSWSPEIQAAVLLDDGDQLLRVYLASEAALSEHQWPVVWALFPQITINKAKAGVLGCALLHGEYPASWDQIVAARTAGLDPAVLAQQVMTEATLRLDDAMVEQALAHGATLFHEDAVGRTMIGQVAAHRLHSANPDVVRDAQAWITRWWPRQPRSAWAPADMKQVVMSAEGQDDWLLEMVGPSLSESQLYTMLSCALEHDRPSLVHIWGQMFMDRLKDKQRHEADTTAGRREVEMLLELAAGLATSSTLLAWWLDRVRPWCTTGGLIAAMETAELFNKESATAVLWSRLPPEEGFAWALGRQPRVEVILLDWMLTHSPKALRDHHLAQFAPEDRQSFPTALERQRIDRLEELAEPLLPKRSSSPRPRS